MLVSPREEVSHRPPLMGASVGTRVAYFGLTATSRRLRRGAPGPDPGARDCDLTADGNWAGPTGCKVPSGTSAVRPREVLLDNARALVEHHDATTREVRFNEPRSLRVCICAALSLFRDRIARAEAKGLRMRHARGSAGNWGGERDPVLPGLHQVGPRYRRMARRFPSPCVLSVAQVSSSLPPAERRPSPPPRLLHWRDRAPREGGYIGSVAADDHDGTPRQAIRATAAMRLPSEPGPKGMTSSSYFVRRRRAQGVPRAT
jgi:hypothetical protein